jgi:uncharacterized protein YaeQ
MALPSTVYKANIELANVDRGIYENLQATVAQHPSETGERLVARLLAWAIFSEPELSFTRGLSATEEPDIWVKGGDGRVLLWVEVGLPDAERIVKASRHAGRVALLASGRTLATWNQQQLPKLDKVTNLTVVTVDQALIMTLAEQLDRVINWSVTITEGMLYLAVGATTYQTAIEVRAGAL